MKHFLDKQIHEETEEICFPKKPKLVEKKTEWVTRIMFSEKGRS